MRLLTGRCSGRLRHPLIAHVGRHSRTPPMSIVIPIALLQRTVVAILATLALHNINAQPVDSISKTPANLMVVLRESVGANKQDESLQPMGKAKVKLADGKEVEFEPANFAYLGDMHVRFVFDGPQTMIGATPEELKAFNLSPEQALSLAIANIKRVYGKPVASPWTGGLMQVQGKSPDVDSSYFLDREFWRELSKKHPDGIVISVAKRGGLVYAPLSDTKAVGTLRRGVAYLHSSSERLRVSSALYLFKDDRWLVFQAPAWK